jgi:hypothetical protein
LQVGIDKRWLETGHHWDIHFERKPAPDNAGAFTGGGWKFLIHITVSPWGAIDSMVNVLNAKRAQPHLVLGGRKGVKHPVCVQMLPFDVAGRALGNDMSDGRQTNRANVIQIEVCANPGRSYDKMAKLMGQSLGQSLEPFKCGTDLFTMDGYYLNHRAESLMLGVLEDGVPDANVPPVELCMPEPTTAHAASAAVAAAFQSGVASWGPDTYKALGNVFELVRHRVEIPNKVASINGKKAFTTDRRFTDREFEVVEGLVGHMDAPDNDHGDPTADFKSASMVRYTKSAPNNL